MMSDPDGTCQELVELMTNYLEGAMSADERAQVERHLAQCTGCRHYLAQLETLIVIAARPMRDELPEATRAALLASFRSAQL